MARTTATWQRVERSNQFWKRSNFLPIPDWQLKNHSEKKLTPEYGCVCASASCSFYLTYLRLLHLIRFDAITFVRDARAIEEVIFAHWISWQYYSPEDDDDASTSHQNAKCLHSSGVERFDLGWGTCAFANNIVSFRRNVQMETQRGLIQRVDG